MKLLNEQELEIKKSRFLAYLYEIESKEEVPLILSNLKQVHKKAKHIPYAYKLHNTAGKNDDKEPSGTSGKPIYLALERSGKENLALFVVRYFGGTKLGASGLTNAYQKAASLVLYEKN